jgi:hypothetical protein
VKEEPLTGEIVIGQVPATFTGSRLPSGVPFAVTPVKWTVPNAVQFGS